MKKCNLILSIVLVLCLSICAVSLCACHSQRVNAGTLDELAGTYKLVEYTMTPDEGDQINMLQEKNIEAYIVVGKDGYGYYAYKDKETDLWYDTIKIAYTVDDENSSLYRGIEYTRGLNVVSSKNDYPGRGKENMGFTKDNQSLNYSILNTKVKINGKELGNDFKSYIRYEKISNETTAATMESKLSISCANLPKYEYKAVNGLLQYQTSYEEDNEFVYNFLTFDSVNLTYSYQYMKKSDMIACSGSDSLEIVQDDPSFIAVKILDVEYKLFKESIPCARFDRYEYDEPDAEGNQLVHEYHYYTFSSDKSIVELMAEAIEAAKAK